VKSQSVNQVLEVLLVPIADKIGDYIAPESKQ